MSHVRTLPDTPLLAGIPADAREGLLEELGAFELSCRKGDSFRRAGDEMDCFPVVVRGRVQATMPRDGQDCIVATFGEGESFAEAVPLTLKRCPVDMRALEDTRVLCIPAGQLAACENSWAAMLRANIAIEMSKKVSVLSQTLAVLGERRLSDRVLAHLRTLPAADDGSVTVPYGRREWAGVLRVAEKSLTRELKHMQEAGLITVKGRRVTIL